MRRLIFAFVIMSMVGVPACGGGSPGSGGGSVSSAPLAGMIDGQSWTFVAGQTDHFLSQGQSSFFTTLYEEAIPAASACAPGDPPGATRMLILNIPMKTGEFPLSFAFNQTFVFPDPTTGRSDNDVATSGTLEVTSISTTEIVGGVKMAFDAKNSVDGQFTVSICQQ